MAAERMEYDLIIVGAGISGLRVGIQVLKANPHLKCCILEKYGYMGGRVVTYRKSLPRIGDVSWENGAGRISTSHKRILGLIKEYGLTFQPMPGSTAFVDSHKASIIQKNTFTDLQGVYFEPLLKLSKDVLQTHTLNELLTKVFGSEDARRFYEMFPYYSEIHTLRADMALASFQHEMRSNEGFGRCKEGYSSIIQGMVTEFIKRGGWVLKGVEVERVFKAPCGVGIGCGYFKESGEKPRVTFFGKTAVLALHRDAVKKIDGVKDLNVLKHLKMEPLLRMYAVFPLKGGKVWFEDLPRIVTNSPIRYIIPIDVKKGIIMISYTDGDDALAWNRLTTARGENYVQDKIMNEIRCLFNDMLIPDPLFFKLHYWDSGCTYWLPGKYDVAEESAKSLQPLADKIPELFMCGESFATTQCWMESALDQADKLLEMAAFKTSILHN